MGSFGRERETEGRGFKMEWHFPGTGINRESGHLGLLIEQETSGLAERDAQTV